MGLTTRKSCNEEDPVYTAGVHVYPVRAVHLPDGKR